MNFTSVISFVYRNDSTLMNDEQITIHLKHEFANIKNEVIDQDVGWRTW